MFGAGDAISVRRSSLTNELSRQEEPMKFTIRDLFLVTVIVALVKCFRQAPSTSNL